ncbi:MAG TPA: hypothetical protein VLJ17_15230 [Xanthobacteraceae bacterium]|nr:hypothetical protein [Xanthobacteraceae bacterium]
MTDGSIKIILEPTKQKVKLGLMEYRVFKGRTSTGIEIEMLGLFRIHDPVKRAEFERAVCAIRIEDPPPITLVSDEGLIRTVGHR